MSESVTIIPYSDNMHQLSSHLDFDLWDQDKRCMADYQRREKGNV